MDEVRAATGCDAPAIFEVLERSLVDDPFVRWLARGRPRAIRSYLRLMLERIALPKGAVFVAEVDRRIVAASLWAPPRTFELTTAESLLLLPTMLSVIGPLRFGRIASILDEVDRARAPEPRWLLTLLGTVPEHRRLGMGAKVLAPVLARCDADRLVAVCETSERQNLAFYGRLGFEVRSERWLGAGGPRSWTLSREPE